MDTRNLTSADEAYLDELARDYTDGEIVVIADLDGALDVYAGMTGVDLEGASIWSPTNKQLHAVTRLACDRERGFNVNSERNRYV